LVVRQEDVRSSDSVGLLRGGDQVGTEPTLDLCNGTFPSEALRSARLQDAVADALDNTVLSTEAVLYQNAKASAQAFGELRNTAAHCPPTPVQSPYGGPSLQTAFNPPPDSAWPQTSGVERVAYDLVTTDEGGQTQHSIAVYLRRGRVLLGVYFPQAPGVQPVVDAKTSIPDIVSVFASRLANLPENVVNRSVTAASLS
jgi:hypothetical protein